MRGVKMKKLVSIFLSVVLIASSVSVGAFAAQDGADLNFAVAFCLHHTSSYQCFRSLSFGWYF